MSHLLVQEKVTLHVINRFIENYTLEEAEALLFDLLYISMSSEALNESPDERGDFVYFVSNLRNILTAVYGFQSLIKKLPITITS